MSFKPVLTSQIITDKYKRYLRTIFSIADPVYAKQFTDVLANEKSFAAGPYLDVTDSFLKGHSIEELIETGLLSAHFKGLKIHPARPLYYHQELAILKLCSGKNAVVSTGTGSGKTESFLIPIFNHILREYETGTLTPGVRALIIYPMNALANDQVERLRDILADFPEITYGSYTGQTKHSFNEALVEYKMLNNNQEPLVNELISREQMIQSPPNILITNYAMLEYLMIRPKDSVFFNGEYAGKWKFIVLDEAHVYSGSTGIEVSMLLRRLKAKLQNEKIQYMLTSATLGSDKDDEDVAQFAKNLCNSDFKTGDIVRAVRIMPEPGREIETLSFEFYRDIALLIERDDNVEDIIHKLQQYVKTDTCYYLPEILYDIVLHDKTYWEIRKLLQTPKTLSALAGELGWNKDAITDFVTVASRCEKDGARLFDARYHMFLRATESVFITLKPNSRLFLNRKEYHYEGDNIYKVFEVATCSSCHVIYLIGRIENGYLNQYNGMGDEGQKSLFLLADNISDTDADCALEDENILYEPYKVCPFYGYLVRTDAVNPTICVHDKSAYIKVFKVKVNTTSGELTKCLSCENVNNFGILRMFFTGHEAVTSVIGTALFEELPSYKTRYEYETVVDDTGFGMAAENIRTTQIEEAKQFIAFSDSRQAAAFYASYLGLTYQNILYKRLIVETLNSIPYSQKPVTEFVEDLIFQFEKYKILNERSEQADKEAWKAILAEVVDNNGNTSLYNMGILGLSVNDSRISANDKLNLSQKEVASICSVFALGMMADAAVTYEAMLTRADKEYFTHNGIEYVYTLSDAERKSYRISFIPTKANMSNKRLDYLLRVLAKKGHSITKERAITLLEAIWKNIFICGNLVKAKNGLYQLDTRQINVQKTAKWFICNKCKKITIHNVENVCPSYKCDGMLVPVNCADIFSDNHYYNLYNEMDIRALRVVEHTAQLDKETAYEYQKKFQRKEIDVLSCSTTFEMGVDVGTLETVFMRNMPPSPANYAQRAGRAGRSINSAAFAITFCNKSNHDFTFFQQPEQMIKGRISPPKFIVENDKIAIRHLYASSLGYFWKIHPELFSKASSMMEAEETGLRGLDMFVQYIESRPEDLKSYLLSFLPSTLSSKFKVNNYGWVEGLVGEQGVLIKAEAEYNYEVGIIKDAIKQAIERRYRVDSLFARLRVYQNEDILSFLSRKNVLPKYGFPVDTVELFVNSRNGSEKLGLQLQRDLSMAISEYAPSSQVVANGNLITSRYIRKIPRMSWKMYDYIQCECKTLNIAPHVDGIDNELPPTCRQCGRPIDTKRPETFLVPEFGFEADGAHIEKPGIKRPERTYRSETTYVGYRSNIVMQSFRINNAEIELGLSPADEMAVLNESRFFVCETCGYTDLDEAYFMINKQKKHMNSSGYPCVNSKLKRYSLGYRFETDVVIMRFIAPDLSYWETSLSVLYAVLRGVSHFLNIEESDISGCLQYYFNTRTQQPNYALVLFDKTPGGAGHVRRLNNQTTLEGILHTTLQMMVQCDCGGEHGDSSCYSCLRGYYNQKHHDKIKRGYVIEFLRDALSISS
ncbi:MAG: ATP-dependent RNA helicase SrmB [Firmicutes bacterium ADurb.Bin419]|nr:MAG: ATP-dependent RNA helicase SrmB [Firmicutes bacterium ADurb.Bin419]